MLQFGARGGEVSTLQTKLKAAGYDPGVIDGIFGNNTLKALKAFQQKAGLVVDGIYGPKSSAALLSWNPSADGGTTPTPSTGNDFLPNTNIEVPETYHPKDMTGNNAALADKAFQHQLSDSDRAIANAMNRRGIYGSTIMGADIADNVDALKKRMDAAWASAYARGYVSNEEAAILGLEPGTRVRAEDVPGGGGGGGGSGSGLDIDAIVKKFNTKQKAIYSAAKSSWSDNPLDSIDLIMTSSDLSDEQKAAIIESFVPTYGRVPVMVTVKIPDIDPKTGMQKVDRNGQLVWITKTQQKKNSDGELVWATGTTRQTAEYWLQMWLATHNNGAPVTEPDPGMRDPLPEYPWLR